MFLEGLVIGFVLGGLVVPALICAVLNNLASQVYPEPRKSVYTTCNSNPEGQDQ